MHSYALMCTHVHSCALVHPTHAGAPACPPPCPTVAVGSPTLLLLRLQVHEVFAALASAVQLNVALVAARSSPAAEAAELLGSATAAAEGPDASGAGAALPWLQDAAAAADAAAGVAAGATAAGRTGSTPSTSGRGGGGGGAHGGRIGPADIVVATPGRLVAHLQGTAGVTLRHLRFLVSQPQPHAPSPEPPTCTHQLAAEQLLVPEVAPDMPPPLPPWHASQACNAHLWALGRGARRLRGPRRTHKSILPPRPAPTHRPSAPAVPRCR